MKTLSRSMLLSAAAALVFALSGCADPTAECLSPDLVCGGTCVSPQVDPNNCGGCGNTCGGSTVCSEGACVCPSGQTDCDGRCVDTRTSSLHCGACGNACEAGGSCVSSACQEGCDGTLCEGVCIQPLTDRDNCGGCGVACGEGQHCLAGSCSQGDLYAACFHAGTVIPFLKESEQRSGKAGDLMGGPQSLALLGDHHLVVVGGMDDTLYVFDRASMDKVGSLLLAPEGGQLPNQVLVKGQRAIAINSGVNTVQVIDLSNPSAPKTIYEVPTGSNTRPMMAAFDASGTLWVSLADTNQVIPVTLGETNGTSGTAIALESAEGSKPYPAGVTVLNGVVYTALNNLDDSWAPAGNGRLATYDTAAESTGLIDLGDDCKNPGGVESDGTLVYVACTGTYTGDGSFVVYDPESESVTSTVTGGAPGRLSLDPSRPGFLYLADNASGNLFAVDDEGEFEAVEACSAETPYEFVSDVLVAP